MFETAHDASALELSLAQLRLACHIGAHAPMATIGQALYLPAEPCVDLNCRPVSKASLGSLQGWDGSWEYHTNRLPCLLQFIQG